MPPLRVLLAAAGWLCVPVVSSLRFNLRQFGGMGDNRTLNTGAFEAGVAAVREAGGGQLYVPPGIYVTTGFALASNMSLFLEAGATIVGLAEFQPVPGSSPPQLLATNWRPRNDSCVSYPAKCKKGDTCPGGVDERHSGFEPLIGGWNLTDVEVTGNNGSLVGQAGRWWSIRQQLQHGRPHALFFSRCHRVVVSNLTIRDSAFWSLRFWASSHVTASNLTVLAPRNVFNNDGVDIDSTSSAVVENIYYDGGDDGVALKSGLGAEGAAFRLPTRGVSVRNVSVRTRSSCLCVGSEMEGGVHDVDVVGVNCRECGDGLRFKTKQTVSGELATNISFSRVRLDTIGSPGCPGYFGIGIATAGCRDVRFVGVNGTGVQDAGNLDNCANISMEDVYIQCSQPPPKGGWHCGKGLSGTFKKATVSPAPCWGDQDVSLAQRRRRPPRAFNLTVISLRPANESTDLDNKDSADAAGDLFFYITDRFVMPYGCRHSQNQEWYCSPNQRALIDAPNQVYSQVLIEVDSFFGGCPSGDCSCDPTPGSLFPCPKQGSFEYADCNPDSQGEFHCNCGEPRCWGSPPTCRYPPPCNVTGKVTIASRYCSMQRKTNLCARCADGCKGVWSRWKSRTASLLDGIWFSTATQGNCDVPGGTCAWRQLRTLKTIDADCANARVHEYIESVAKCFGQKPVQGYNRTTDSYIECTFETLLNVDPKDPSAMPRPGPTIDSVALVGSFLKAFESDSPAEGGCPNLTPPMF